MKKQLTTKKEIFCNVHGFNFKELEDNLEIGGFIATTHLDDGWYSEDCLVRDKISKDTLESWAELLNEGNPQSNKVSVNHDRGDKIVAGVGKRDTAKVVELTDGEFGLYIDTILDSTHPDFDSIKNRIDIGTLDSFSIEFQAGPSSVMKDTDSDYMIRELNADSMLYGYTLASRPMNEHAVMLKEIMKMNNKVQKQTEVNKMTEEKVKVDSEVKEESAHEPEAEPVKEEPKPETEDEKEKKVDKMEVKESPTISEEDMKILQEAKEIVAKKAQEKQRLELIDSVKEDLKKSFESLKVENKVMFTGKEQLECKEAVEFKEMLVAPEKVHIEQQFRIAGKMADKLGFTVGGLQMDSSMAESRDYKNFSCNGNKLEFKGLGITSNQNTDTDYLLSAAELRDVFDPVIYNALNEATVTWNLLTKEDFSMKGNNQVQFTLKTTANTTAAAYLGNAVSTSNTGRLKVQTKFKKYQVGVEVDGDMIASARGGPFGDVFAVEVRDSTESLLSVVNQALFAEVGLETAAGIIGFEYLSDSAGNTTLYNMTRTDYLDVLSCTTVADQYINGASADLSLANLRALKRNALKRGLTRIQDLVFIGDPIQGDKMRGIYDAAQRMIPTISRWGFEGMMSFDGIPFFEDKDCADDDVWLVDLSKHKVAMWVPPTLEMLGKDSDSVKGFIKMYFATYNTLPTTVGQIYSNATT